MGLVETLIAIRHVKSDYRSSNISSSVKIMNQDNNSKYYFFFINTALLSNCTGLKAQILVILENFSTIFGQSTVFVSIRLLACIHYCDFTVSKPETPKQKSWIHQWMTSISALSSLSILIVTLVIVNHVENELQWF